MGIRPCRLEHIRVAWDYPSSQCLVWGVGWVGAWLTKASLNGRNKNKRLCCPGSCSCHPIMLRSSRFIRRCRHFDVSRVTPFACLRRICQLQLFAIHYHGTYKQHLLGRQVWWRGRRKRMKKSKKRRRWGNGGNAKEEKETGYKEMKWRGQRNMGGTEKPDDEERTMERMRKRRRNGIG